MKKSITIFGYFIFCVFCMQNCGLENVAGLKTSFDSKKIDLTTEPEIIKFTIDEDAQYPHSMSLIMKGNINGKGILQFGWNDSVFYHTDSIADSFLVESIGGDWYNDDVIIKYTPLTATTGNLEINCEINSSKK